MLQGFMAAVLAVCMVALQYRLWFGKGSFPDLRRLEHAIAAQSVDNQGWSYKNQRLQLEIVAMKKEVEAVEEQAREILGFVKPKETFCYIQDPAAPAEAP